MALRIPKSFAAETALGQGTEVDLTLEEGRLVVTPLAHPEYTLDALLARVTPENVHRETDTGPAVGDEVW